MEIPADVPELLRQRAARDAEEHQRERAELRARRARERRARARCRKLAARALRFAAELAASGVVPARGVEVFRGGFHTRFTGAARVMPTGALALGFGSYMGGGCWEGRAAADFEHAPEVLLRALVDAIESAAVWEHVRRAARVPRC